MLGLEWTMSDLIAGVALILSVAGFFRARSADRRSGLAIIEAELGGASTFDDASYGRITIRISNKGPAVATKVTVVIHESAEDASVRQELRGHSKARTRHITEVADRLGVDETIEVKATGVTAYPERVEVKWRDSAGRQKMHPGRRTTPKVF